MTYIPSEIFSFSFLKEHHLLLHLHQTKIKNFTTKFKQILVLLRYMQKLIYRCYNKIWFFFNFSIKSCLSAVLLKFLPENLHLRPFWKFTNNRKASIFFLVYIKKPINNHTTSIPWYIKLLFIWNLIWDYICKWWCFYCLFFCLTLAKPFLLPVSFSKVARWS